MPCPDRWLSYASWRLKVFRRIFPLRNERRVLLKNFFAWNVSSTSGVRGAIDGEQRSRVDAYPTGGNNNNTTFDPEKHDANREKDTSMRPSQLLPKSPFMDKVRSPGDKKRKRRATKEDNARLRDNPWAMALASPPSMCVATGARQPRELLRDFGLLRRPGRADGSGTADVLWWMPVGLWKDELKASILHPEQQQQRQQGQGQIQDEREPQQPARQRVLYLSNRALLLRAITRQGNSHMALIPHRWKSNRSLLAVKDMRNIFWREDMPSFVLRSLGKEVVKAFTETSRWGTVAIKPSADMWRAIPLHDVSSSGLDEGLKSVEMENMGTGGVVIFGDGDTSSGPFMSVFPDYVTLPQSGSRVPVFDLNVLLSQSHQQEFRQIYPHFGTQVGVQAWFFRPDGPKSVSAVLALWRLKGYIMYDAEFLAQEPSLDP